MKKRTILDLVIIFALLILLIFLGKKDYNVDKTKDNKRFDKEYSMVNKENVFKYTDEEEVLNILKTNGIIFMAFKENKWSNYYAKILNEAAKTTGVQERYYYNFLPDRNKKSVDYKKITELLKNYLKKNDLGEINLNAPCLIVVKDGNLYAYDDETSEVLGNETPESYWTDETMNQKLEQFKIIFTSFLGGTTDGGEE